MFVLFNVLVSLKPAFRKEVCCDW